MLLRLHSDMCQSDDMVQGAQKCPCLFTEGLALSLSDGLGFRASGGLRGTDCRTAGPDALLTYLSGELPRPLLMWTLASTPHCGPCLTLTTLQLSKDGRGQQGYSEVMLTWGK